MRSRKPEWLVPVNKSHPIAQDMIAFVVFNGAGKPIYNAVTGQYFDEGSNNIDGTQLSRSVGIEGRSVTGGSGNTGKLELHKDLDMSNYSYITVLNRVKYASNTVDHGMFQNDLAIGTGKVLLWADTLSNQLRPGAYSGTGKYGASNSLPINEWVTWGASYQITDAAPFVKFYTNGLFDVETGTVGDSKKGGALPWTYLNKYDTTRPFYGECSWIAVWGRELAELEHLSFYKNPWQTLIKQKRVTGMSVAAVGGVTVPIMSHHYTKNIGAGR